MISDQLSLDVYRIAIEHTPVLCVDVVLRDAAGQYVLFRRNNEPLKGQPWVCGGRVHKGEMAQDAAIRKLRDELGLAVTPQELRFVGYYEEQFEFSHFGRGPYHAVSMVFECSRPVDPAEIVLDAQHSEVVRADALPPGFTARITVGGPPK